MQLMKIRERDVSIPYPSWSGTGTDLGMSVPPGEQRYKRRGSTRSSTPIVLIVVITGKITRPTHPPTRLGLGIRCIVVTRVQCGALVPPPWPLKRPMLSECGVGPRPHQRDGPQGGVSGGRKARSNTWNIDKYTTGQIASGTCIHQINRGTCRTSRS